MSGHLEQVRPNRFGMFGIVDIRGHLEQFNILRFGISWMLCREVQFIHSKLFSEFITGVDRKFLQLVNRKKSRVGKLGISVIE